MISPAFLLDRVVGTASAVTTYARQTTIDWASIYASMDKPAFVFDGRLLLDADKLREIGFKVKVIGRGERL